METNTRQVSRRLHEEHQATIALWSRVEAALVSGKADPALLRSAAAALAHELGNHFEFEERHLFPLLAAAGEGDIGELLRDEHEAIRAAGKQYIALVKDNPLDTGVKPLGLELAERLFAHVQKEEMSLLPMLDDLLDDATDETLAGELS
jgi:iron-sulfur cluster repair protein YtfE (RIC family)